MKPINWRNKLPMLCAMVLLLGPPTIVGCSIFKEAAKAPLTEAFKEGVGDELAKQLPADKQVEFLGLFATEPGAAMKFFAAQVGVNKLADAIEGIKTDNEALRASNKAQADELRSGGTEKSTRNWVDLALLGAIGLVGKTGWKYKGIATSVFQGLHGFLKKDDVGNASLLAEIKSASMANGNKSVVENAFGKAVDKMGEKPVVVGA